jgi:hypothetical protein|tara:strand:- start:25 stop:807 length:783 start_codon:yes stop_codon:yes gene_type:complete
MVNVNTVYQTVLLILNQQQRGYITPDEFNKIAAQAQLTIFEAYASDLNQQYRVSQNDTEYANRIKNIQLKLQPFQKYVSNTTSPGAITGTNPFTLNVSDYAIPTAPVPGVLGDFYRLGSVIYKGIQLNQYAQRNEITQLLLSPLTQPTKDFPIFLYEAGATATSNNGLLYIYPTSITNANDINISYLAKPINPIWGFTLDGTTGAYLYSASASTDFQLDVSEQTEIILRILAYAGVIIEDPTIIQVASQAVSAEDANEKQ